MGELNWQKVETIIDTVLDLPKEQRQTYIDKQCKGNKQLKSEVTLLLESIFDSEGWLDNPGTFKEGFYSDISEHTLPHSSPDALLDKQIGSYILKELIGEGGMGTVYRAERVGDEFDHQVAIKIIRHERATEKNIRRFEHEQRILAGLNHPGIAKLFDGGITEDGFPYIIMEYVSGIPIDEYCQVQNRSVDEKLSLFKQVLEAVRYAHENLVIHRDLKPGNILVDESGSIKILDFGISKLLAQEKSEDLTQTGARLLTPRYAAPEQIKQQNITTATDLYALGLILFRLLTEAYPFSLDNQNRYETEQTILNTEPAKPSSAVGSKQLRKTLSGDLDAIVLKALRKEPKKRYRVASEFLDDLDDYEQGIPVGAHADSMSYRIGKFFKRHKQGIAVAAGILLLLIGFTAFYTWRIAQERNQAQIEAQKAQNVRALLVDIFEANDPISGDAETATLPQLLENGTNEILERDIDPEVKVELLLTLGTIYQNITEFDKAEELARKTLEVSNQNFGSNSVNAAKSYIKLGGIDYDLGNYEEGKKELQKARDIIENKQDNTIPEYTELYHHLGFIEEGMSNYDSSRVYFQKAFDNIQHQTRIDTAIYIDVIKSLARNIHRTGDYKKADSLMFVALETSKRFNGENDIVTASIAGDIGLYYMTRAKYDSSRVYYQRSLDIKEKLYNDKPHPKYSATLTNLGVLEAHVGNYTVAESLFTKTLDIDKELFGNDHPYVAFSKGHLAKIYQHKGQLEKAKRLKEEQLQIYKNSYDSDHYNFAGFYRDYADLLSAQKEYQKADLHFQNSENIYSKYKTTPEINFAKLYETWGENYYRMNRFQAAAEKFENAAEIFNPSKYDEYKIRGTKCMIKAGKSYLALGQVKEAEKFLKQVQARIDTTKVLTADKEVKSMYLEAHRSLQQN